ncbi:MAG: CCA tRNA nucleotidyltransferase [Candidatus Phytoplasma sp.]|nr:CCA tRNA nucleotidyltransferase [Phytoplasma sp.]
MEKIRKAQKIIRIFKKHEFEAYIVGGAVRDHILNIPLTDIDITTNAKPHEVSKIFKTEPTGVKYGTVTAFFEDEQFEITTYRQDGPYDDNRHPSEIIFSDNVLDDLSRRDFRMNGLLMDANLNVIDHVEGLEDIKQKVIQTIGDPVQRFNEDSLRILRAAYFESKLGFNIHMDTLVAMRNQASLIENLANERILQEMIKIIKGEHAKKAFMTLMDTGIDKYLPGLEKGLNHAVKIKKKLTVDIFFMMAFSLNKSVPKAWKFSNKHRHRYQTVSHIVNKIKKIDELTLYEYGIENCLLANHIQVLLGYDEDKEKAIRQMYDKMTIKSELDLKLSATEMLERTHKKAGSWVGNIRKELVEKVLRNEIENEKEVLFSYVLEKIGE